MTNNIEKLLFRIKTSSFNPFLKTEYNKNEDHKGLIKFCENKTIALVGGSKTLIEKDNKIDKFDLVIRINHLPEKKISTFIGKRCDILMLSRNPINLINKNFIKIWMTPKNRYLLNYAKGEFYSYPLTMWSELSDVLKSRPSTGAMALHFLKTNLPNNKIYLFGFDHDFNKVWYSNNSENLNNLHNPVSEKKYFKSITGDLINYVK